MVKEKNMHLWFWLSSFDRERKTNFSSERGETRKEIWEKEDSDNEVQLYSKWVNQEQSQNYRETSVSLFLWKKRRILSCNLPETGAYYSKCMDPEKTILPSYQDFTSISVWNERRRNPT